MEISRRNVLRLSLAGGGGTALGGLIASGVNLAPAVTQAQELRIAKAKVAVLVLVGGFLLRVVIILSSEAV